MATQTNEQILSDAFSRPDLYTPMSQEDWERNTAIVEQVLSEVFDIKPVND